MGILKKITPTKLSTKSAAPAGGADKDDEATVFTTAMICYWGFFAVTLIINPSVHALDGPFPNPMAYWKTLTENETMIFRIAGCAFLTLLVGPFFDEIFGGVGVKMMAFARQMCFINLLSLFIFLWYSFYSPLDTAVTFMWEIQAAVCGLLVGWSVVEVVDSAETIKTLYVVATVGLFAFFGLGLIAAPSLLFGPPSPVKYWNTWTDLTILLSRGVGIVMTCTFLVGYFVVGKSAGFAKLCTAFNLGVTTLLVLAVTTLNGPSSVDSMFKIQVCFNLPFVVVGLYLELAGLTGAWEFKCAGPKWGANAETYCMLNVIFNVPFAIGFLTVPNMLFGPSSISGMAMFTSNIDETGLWFGKVWGLCVFLITVSPYVFGFPYIKTTKIATAAYLLYCGLFAYGLFVLDVFNFLLVAPLAFLQVLFFGAGLFLSLPAQAGEAML